LDELADHLANVFTYIDDLLCDSTTVESVKLYLMEWSVDKWETSAYIGEAMVDVEGTSATELNAGQVAPYVYLGTARPKSRGRKFIAGTAVGIMDDGQLRDDRLVELASFATNLLATPTITPGNTLIPGVGSTKDGVFLPFVIATAVQVPGTQRRRRMGVGS
jgi:hypothetical protein